MKNKIYIQYLWFAIFVLMATVVSLQQVDPAKDFSRISYRFVEPPIYYPTRTALIKNEPLIQSADIGCNNLLFENGASLTIGGTYKFPLGIDANSKGSLIMNNTNSMLNVNKDVKWFAGS